MQTIKGYQFDLTKKIYLNSPKKKFWEVKINDEEVFYRAGVIRGESQFKILQINKNYQSGSLARAIVITKIAGKIAKGYYSTTAKKTQANSVGGKFTSKPVRRKRINEKINNSRTKQKGSSSRGSRSKKKQELETMSQQNYEGQKKLWKGLEHEDEAIQFKVIGNQLKIMRRNDQQQSSQLKTFKNFEEAVDYVHTQQNWYGKQGFKPLKSTTFLEQQTKKQRSSANVLMKSEKCSLTNMTDNAIWKGSDRAQIDEGQNIYKPNAFLGPPIDQCIKCLLAQNYKDGNDPTGWIMSEKLDGVRCLWTGTEMFSRNGNHFNFPNFFTKNWPKSQLDGQLFIGRGKFSQTLSAVKKLVPVTSEWENVKYLVFDAPGLVQPFDKRIKIIQKQLSKIDNPYIKCHAHRSCEGFPDLFQQLEKVNKAQGQGIMLRQPSALYQNKRSKNLQKVKTFHDDQAEVIGYTEGTGRCLGMVGALRVRKQNGVQFQVGSGLNDQLRKNPPQVGQKITFKYQQLNKQSGKPRFPTFLRIYKQT